MKPLTNPFIPSNSFIDQFNEFYYKYDKFQTSGLSHEHITNYHAYMLENNRLDYYIENGELLGYVESWKINFEQWGRLVCHAPFNPLQENIGSGDIAYVANVTIKPEYRKDVIAKYLRNKFFIRNFDCEYFVGEANRKKTGLIKVFTKKNAMQFINRSLEESNVNR